MPGRPTKAHERLWFAINEAERALELSAARLVIATHAYKDATDAHAAARDRLGSLRREEWRRNDREMSKGAPVFE